MLKYLAFGLALFLFGACERNTPEKECLISSVKKEGVKVNLSSLLSSYKLIPLETHPDGLVGSIQKIVKHNGHYYIRSDRNQLFVFDGSGRFVRRISSQGGGPGEYSLMKDFDVDENFIVILENRKIHYFDPDGKYLRTVKLAQGTSNIKLLPNGDALIKTDMDYAIRLIDRNGKLKENFLKMNKALAIGQDFGFYRADSLVFYFNGAAANIIWQYDLFSGKGKDLPVFDLPGTISPEKEEDLLTEQGFEYIFENTSDLKARHISAAGSYLISYVYKTDLDAVLYFCHFPTEKAKGYPVKNILDDILFQGSIKSISYSMYGQSETDLISYVYPYEIEGGLEQYKDLAGLENYRHLQKMLDTLGDVDDANPVLFEFTPKQQP